MHFWSFWAKYCHFLPILSNAWPKNNVNKVPRWVFRYMGNKTFDFSSKKRIFCPKTTKFGPKLAFLVNLGQAMQAYSVPCWWDGWWLWRAGCISQDTYLLYCTHFTHCSHCNHCSHCSHGSHCSQKCPGQLKSISQYTFPGLTSNLKCGVWVIVGDVITSSPLPFNFRWGVVTAHIDVFGS